MAYTRKVKAPQGGIVLPRRLYLKADHQTICEDGDSEAKFLIGAKGYAIRANKAKNLGLAKYLADTEKASKPKPNKRKRKPANKSTT